MISFNSNSDDLMGGIRREASALLAQTDRFADPFMRAAVTVWIAEEYAALKKEIANPANAALLESLLPELHALSVDDIAGMIGRYVARTRADAENMIMSSRHMIEKMDAREYAALGRIFDCILPSAANTAFDGILAHKNGAGGDGTLKAEELAAFTHEICDRLPLREAAQALHEMARKTTAGSAVATLGALTARLSAEDISGIVFDGIDVLNDMLANAGGAGRIRLADAEGALEFAGRLGKLLTAVGESLSAAGIRPDIDLRAVFSAAYAPGSAVPPAEAAKSRKAPAKTAKGPKNS